MFIIIYQTGKNRHIYLAKLEFTGSGSCKQHELYDQIGICLLLARQETDQK
jgi:hypothetical protein